MNLSPRQLQIFVSLAHSLNFSRTADQFCVTQPTLSKIVREVEDEFGIRLFERNTRSVRLTPDGAALLGVATRVAQDYEMGVAELEEVARRRARRLLIAAMPSVAGMLLPRTVATLRADIPNAYIKIHDVAPDAALELLRARKVDLAITALSATHKDLANEEVARDRFVLLSAKQYPPELDANVWSEAAVSTLQLISMPRGTSTRQYIDAAFMKKNLQFRPFLELNNLLTMANFVKAGCGVALMPQLAAQLVLDDQLLITSLAGAPERSIGLVTRRDDELPPLAAAMMLSLRQNIDALLKT
jgi:DNA-binding transcriptional LysR family regulator